MPSLYIADSRSPRERYTFWPRQQAPSDLLVENQSYYIDLGDVEDPDAYDLYIDDNKLQALRSPTAKTARWLLQIGFYAGWLEFSVKKKSRPIASGKVEFSPNLAKLTRADFDTMVSDLLADTVALFSLSSFRTNIGRGTGRRRPPIARLEFLRSKISQIEKVLTDIDRQPIRVLRGTRERISIDRARHVTRQDLSSSFKSNVLRRHNNTAIERRLRTAFIPSVLNRRRNVVDTDIQEHRAIKTALHVWQSWLCATAALLHRDAVMQDEGAQQMMRWRVRCIDMANRLNALSQLPIFEDVADVSTRVRLSPVFRWVPAYSRFYRLYRDFSLGIARIHGEFLDIPLARTFELYELWVFIRLVQCATQLFGLKAVDPAGLFERGKEGISLRSGSVFLRLNDDVTMCFQRSYREYWLSRETPQMGSFSRTMIPDVSIETKEPLCAGPSLIVLDAKYRIDYQLNDAISSLHSYRDAIVRAAGDDQEQLQRAAIGSYIITPHVLDQAASIRDWTAEGMPARLFHPKYRGRFKFGAVTLRPRMKTEEVEEALRLICADSGIALPVE